MEITAKAFWSYAHADNEREGGRILRLAELVQAEYELLTGTAIEIFTDREKIGWGDDFRAKLEEALQETAFFVPILTPTYFLRDECRKEMSTFVRSATALGLQQLLLSIRYIPVADLTEQSADELKAVAARMQYEPWDSMRLHDEGSPEHRHAVNGLAQRLAELTSRLESGPSPSVPSAALQPAATGSVPARQPIETTNSAAIAEAPGGVSPEGANSQPQAAKRAPAEDEVDDDEPGLLDLVADAQPAMEAWTETVTALNPVSERFNAKFQSATARMNDANKRPDAFARKLLIARELAADIEPELSELERLSREYSSGLIRVDARVRAILEVVELATDDSAATTAEALRESLTDLVDKTRVAMNSLQSAADAARANAKLSRDLRPVLRRYETAVRNMVDGFAIIQEWESTA